MSSFKCKLWMDNEGLPMSRPFFSQARLGGGMPVASQAKVTGLLIVSTTLSSVGPSILGGTEKRVTVLIFAFQMPSIVCKCMNFKISG